MEVRPGYKRTKVGVIPEDWEVKRIGDISTAVRGASPRPAGDPRYFNGSFIPWLTVAALTNIPSSQVHVHETVGHLTEEGAQYSRILEKGTLIIANSGATLGVAKILSIRCCANDGVAALLNQRDCDNLFLVYYLNSQTKRLREVVATGLGQPNLNTGLIESLSVPIPPLSEQRAIAEVLSDVDALIAALDRLIAKKRAIKQGTMQQLLAGTKRLPEFSGAWETKQLGELIHLIPSGIYGVERQTQSPVGMPVATTAHIDITDSWNDREMEVRYFTESQVSRYAPLEGDLIVVKSSGSAASIQSGKIGFVSGDKIGSFVFSNFLMLLRPIACNPRFLFFQLVSERVKRMLPRLVEASTYPNIRINDYLEIPIPLPKAKEQLAIAAILSDMDAEIAALEVRRDKTRALKQGMMQELLTGRTRLI